MKNFILICLALFVAAGFTSCNKGVDGQPIPVDSLKIGLIAYYPMNNTGADSSGHGNDGTVFNVTSTTDRNGKANRAYHFDGLTSYISVKDNQDLRLTNTNITLSAWVKLDNYNNSFGNNVLSKHYAGADNGWAWGITGQAYIPTGVVTYGPGGGSANSRGTKVMAVNQWHMLSSTYNFTTKDLKIYVDGVLDNVTPNMPSPNPTINADIYIGRDEPSTGTNGYFVHGSIDEVRIYNRLLTASEIQKLYTYKN